MFPRVVLRFTLVLKQKLLMEYFDRVMQVHVVKVDADRIRTIPLPQL